MPWHHLLQARKNSDPQRKVRETTPATPLGFALEARMMFDGAVAATVAQAENAQPAADAAHTAASDSKDNPHAGDGTQTQANQAQQDQNAQADSHDDSSATHDVAVATDAPRKEVVFIDTSVSDYQSLVDNVPAGLEIELFDGSKDGLSQLVQWAQSHSGYDAIHILSHGGEGEVQLGTLTLDSATATARAADLATLGAALTESGDLLLYGCDVAENTGQSFVSLMAQLTGADIAASTDATGASAEGGDWELESHTGLIETTALHIDGYRHVLDVTGTTVELQLGGAVVYSSPVDSGVEFFLDDKPNVNESNNYIDIDPVNSTITMTLREGAYPNGLTSFDVVFSGGTLQAITSITKDTGASNSVADISTSVNGNDKTITFHFNVDSQINNDGVLVWHFTSTNTVQDTAPTVTASGGNPTFTEKGAAVALFNGVTADTHDSGQTFTGAQFTVSNVSANTEYLTINGVNVALSNGNSILLGGSYGTASVSLSGGIATITLSGATLSNADMSSLLSGMTYGNSSDNPGSAARTVTLTQLTDSGTSNNTVAPNISSVVAVVPVNDAPTEITLSSTAFGQSTGSNAVVATLTATDVDSSAFTYSLVSGVGDTDNARFTLLGDTLRVNASGMSAGTYSVRLQVSDGQATFDKVVLLTVVDDIAPTYDQAPAISNATSGGFTISGSVTEASTFYYVVVPDGASAPTAAQVIAGQNASGGFANASGYQILNASPYDFSLALSGLAASTMYDVYVVAKDSAGNNTVSVVKMDATTASAGTAPSVSATGSNTVFIGGMAGSVDLFSGVTANTNDNGQTFMSIVLTVSNVTDSGEFINIAGNNISLNGNSFGTLNGLGNYSIVRSGSTAIVQLNGLNASNDQFAGLVDGFRYGNSSENVTAGTRTVTVVSVYDSGTSNSITSLNISASVNVLASNAALYVTSGSDTGDDAGFGGSIQDDVNDGGGLSLREALYWANQMPGVDRIVFQTDVTLASSIIVPTQTMLIDGQSFTLNGGGYSGFEITTSSITFAVQNLTLTNFSTDNNMYTGGIIGLSFNASNVNLLLYNVDISGNRDEVGFGNGMIDLYNIAPGSYVFDLDRVNIHDNTLFGRYNDEGVIKLFVSGAQQTVNLSITNSSISNNIGITPAAGNTGVSGLFVMTNSNVAPTTNITLMNSTITGQDFGIIFSFTNNAASWVASVRNSIISGNTLDLGTAQNHTTGTYTINGANNLIGSAVNFASATDPRLAATAANAINQGDRFYVTGDTDVRGLDRTRQGGVDIGAYESQFAAGTAPQVDLNGSNAGVDFVAGVPTTDLGAGIAITDSQATLTQTDGDSRIWSMTLSLNGVQDSGSETLTLSQAARLAAHAAGINITSDGQTLTLTGGATTDAFQTVLRAIMYVNVATTPSGGTRTISVTVNDDATSTATSTLIVVAGNPPVVSTPVPAQSVAQNGNLSFTLPAGTFTDPDSDPLTLSATLADGSALPAWLNFDPVTGTFSGTPDNADVGSLSIKVTATDTASNSVSTTFSLTVTNVNDAPVVSMPIPLQAVWQGQSLSFTVPAGTFSDPDGDTLTLSATLASGSALPNWLHFNPTTGTFSGTPGNSDVGSLSIKLTATDPDNAAVSTIFNLLVVNVNDAPQVAVPVPPQSIAQGGDLNFTLPAGTFVDPDGDILALTATLVDGSPLPAWLTFNPTTGTFSGTPGNANVGLLNIKLTATDPGNASVSTTFELTVTNVNDAPVVATPIPGQGVLQDSSLNFTVPAGTFSDPDGDTLTLSATLADGSALPTWLHFNPTTGTFSGTPGNADVGILSIKLIATDPSNATTSTTFDLFVLNVNDAPEVATTIPTQSVAEGSILNFVVPPGTFSDPDGDILTLSATLANGAALPGWLHFDPTTNTFSGMPDSSDLGSLTIRVTANDGDASVSTDFVLNIVLPNDAPIVSGTIPPQSVAQDGSFSLTVPAGTFIDPDSDPLTLSATLADGSALPTWLHFDPTTGTFSGTPGNADVGNLSIKLTATDPSNASVSTTFALTVINVNDAPIIGATIPPQAIAQDGSLNFTVPTGTFIDPDGDPLTLSATQADGTALPSWLHFDPATRTFTGTPGNADVGSLSIKLTATDPSEATISTTFALIVTNVNDAPVVDTPIPPQSILQDGSLNFAVPAGTFVDPDGDTLTLSATLANGDPLPSWLHFDPATNTFSGTPGNADVGSLVIKITANDGDASVSTTFALTVVNVNDAPVVSGSIPAQSVAQDGSFSLTVPAGTFSDPDGDTLTLSATLANGNPLPTWLHFDPATRTFSGTPGNADVGSLSIKLTATDPSEATISTTFALIVTNVNDAPVVDTPIPPQSILQDGNLNFAVPAGTFVDPDGDTLTLSATLANGDPLPNWLHFDPATNTFSGTPGNADVGNLVIKITANDGDASVSTTFALTVVNVNDAPVVSGSIPAQSVAQDGSFSLAVPAGTFSDPDGDTLTLSATLANGNPLPTWLHFDPTTGTFSGTPGNADVGNLSIKVTATDPDNATISTSFNLTITNVNDAPVVGSPIPAQNIAQDGSLNFTVPAGTFVDPDGDTLTLSATLANGDPLPAWLHFDPATNTFSGTPGNADVGNLAIKVTANDGDASVSTTFALVVTNVNDTPVVSGSIPAQSVAQDGSFSLTIPAGTFVDPDGDTLTLSATLANGNPLPTWLHFDPATGTFSGTPGNADVGNLSIRITASDGSASVSTSFNLTVTNVNDAPVVGTPIPAQNIAQDGSLNFTVPAGTFVDPDGDTLTLSATLANGDPLPAWLHFDPATNTFSGTPGNADVGNLAIKVTANDGDASVSTTFALVVTNVNDTPVVSGSIPAQSVTQDGSFSLTVPAGTFSDPDGDALTLSATLANGNPLPSWLHFDPTTGTFSGTPGNADVGNLSIRITASDGSASVSTSFNLTVTNVNDAPVVSGSIPAQSIAQGGSLNFTLPAGIFTDPDGDALTLSATLADGSALPAWLSFNPSTGTFSGTPDNASIGSLVIQVTATDGDNTSISTTFGLTVTRASIIAGDPQFRITDGANGPRPGDSHTPGSLNQGTGAPPLNTLFTPPTLGSFSAGRTAGSGSMMGSIFNAARDDVSGDDSTKSPVANIFGRGSSFGSRFESSLGSFPSFSKDPALGGTSSLASVFSGIYLPSLTPMEVFTNGSWKDINLHSQTVTAQGTEHVAAAFTPSLHRQLQHIGEAEGQRLSAIEQALHDRGQQQG